jgi:hypothetical protein
MVDLFFIRWVPPGFFVGARHAPRVHGGFIFYSLFGTSKNDLLCRGSAQIIGTLADWHSAAAEAHYHSAVAN